MSSQAEARILLEPGTDVDDVYVLANRLNYFLHQMGERQQGRASEDIWLSMDKSGWLHLVHDPHVDLSYLVVKGGDAAAVVAAAKEQLGTIESGDALRLLKAATSTGEKVDALYKLAVAGGSGAVDAVKGALGDEDATVRHAAIVAVGYLGGRELRSSLKKVAEEDGDEKVRKDAALMLDVLEKES